MSDIKRYYKHKTGYAAYEHLTLIWPCSDRITKSLIELLPEGFCISALVNAINSAIVAYHQDSDHQLNDWERLALYFISMVNFITNSHEGKMTFSDVHEKSRVPQRLSQGLIKATAEKLSLRIAYA